MKTLESLLLSECKRLNRLAETGTAMLSITVRDGHLCICLQHDALGCSGVHQTIQDAIDDVVNDRRKIDAALKNFGDLLPK